MRNPAAYLPPPIPDSLINTLLDSLSFPLPTSISCPKVNAVYHSVYILSFDRGTIPGYPNVDSLILRVAGGHLPRIKTENESAVITWLTRNVPSMPVPAVIHHDSTTDNPLGYEYELMICAPGVTLTDIFVDLPREEQEDIISQLVDILAELHRHKWSHIGGLRLSPDGEIDPGPVLEENFWHQPEIEEYWSDYPTATTETLNINGPYAGYVEYISAHIERYIFAIKTHDALEFMRDVVPRLEGFIRNITRRKDELNNVKLRLAHKDLHFGNVMYDTSAKKITAILDWEFAGVVPYPQWDPSPVFLACLPLDDGWLARRDRNKEVFKRIAREKGYKVLLDDAEYTSFLQEHMQLAQSFLRDICQAAPRGEREGDWIQLKQSLIEHVAALEKGQSRRGRTSINIRGLFNYVVPRRMLVAKAM